MKTPPRSSRPYRVVILLTAALFTGCGGNGDGSDGENPRELTGLIVDVQGRGNDIRGFTLQTADGQYRLRIAPEVDYGFQLRHLRAHENSLFPVRCTLQRRAGGLYVIAIVDA